MLGLLTLSSSHPVKRAQKREDRYEGRKVEVSKTLVQTKEFKQSSSPWVDSALQLYVLYVKQ